MPGTETKQSLSNKMSYAYHEMDLAKSQDFLSHIFTNDKEEDFIKKATVHLLF